MMRDHQRGGIYHPIYVESGRSVVTPGANSDTLSIFDVNTGTLISGVLSWEKCRLSPPLMHVDRELLPPGLDIVLIDAVHEQRAE